MSIFHAGHVGNCFHEVPVVISFLSNSYLFLNISVYTEDDINTNTEKRLDIKMGILKS